MLGCAASVFGAWANIRDEERWDTLVASLSLFSFMAAHALLETARDALFLASIDATRLPYVYLAVAAVALGITRLQSGDGDGRRLALWLVAAGGLTLGFWPLVAMINSLFYGIRRRGALLVRHSPAIRVGLAPWPLARMAKLWPQVALTTP